MTRQRKASREARQAAARNAAVRPLTGGCRACRAYGVPLDSRRLCTVCAQLNVGLAPRYRATTKASPVTVRRVEKPP